jgi:hypothetical protein
MPDTGAPWNIPYVEPADLVRDWPALSEDVAEAVADGLDAANVGIGKNVVQAIKTDTFTTTNTAFTNVTGLSVSITPTSASSKILVIAQVHVGVANSDRGAMIRIDGGNLAYFGATAGSRTTAATGISAGGGTVFDVRNYLAPTSAVALDSPNTTSATTYNVQVRQGSGTTAYINREHNDSDGANTLRPASSLTVIEVAA